MPFVATRMELEIIIYMIRKKEIQIPCDITYMWNLNMTQLKQHCKATILQ